jgi:hypothetical protein
MNDVEVDVFARLVYERKTYPARHQIHKSIGIQFELEKVVRKNQHRLPRNHAFARDYASSGLVWKEKDLGSNVT